MANTFKNYFGKNVSANTTIFTAGAGVQATVIGMTIANLTTSPISANVFITASGTDYYMVSQATIAVGGAFVPIGGDRNLSWKQLMLLKFQPLALVTLFYRSWRLVNVFSRQYTNHSVIYISY